MSHLIAFDLDGTLVDSRQDLTDSANEMLESYGARPLEVDTVAGMVGDGAAKLVLRALAMAGAKVDGSEALKRFLEIYERRLVVHTRPYDGLAEAIDVLASRATLAVLTNKPEGLSRRLLEAFGLASKFRWVIGGDSAFPRKPDPAGLLHLMVLAGSGASSTILVGDSPVDLETARRAGTAALFAHYGFGGSGKAISLTGNELVADAPGDVRPLLLKWLGA